MRNLIFAINFTLDGCCDHTKVTGHDDLLEYFIPLTQNAGLQIFGRKTYQLMVPYWPEVAKQQSGSKAENEFARAFDPLPKVVFSRSLERVEEPNTRIVRTNLRDEIVRLKHEPGKPILVGGVDLASQLIQLGLVDEYRFVVHPILAGEGRRIFDATNLPQKLHLKLVDTKLLGSSCVALHYAK